MRAGPALVTLAFSLICGSASAMPPFEEAKDAFERGLFPAAHNKLLLAAHYGDPAAQELVGFMYALGPQVYPGIKQDLVTATFWLSRAANNGRPAARHLYCAVVRQALPTRKLGLLHCFDETTHAPDRH